MILRSYTLLILVLAAACIGAKGDCPDGYARDNDGNCVEMGDDDDGSSNSDDDDDDGNNNNNDDDDDNNNNNNGGDDGAGVGEACFSQDDCAGSLICVVQDSSDDQGICTETCSSWADCSEAFWDCCDLNNGTTACIPDNWQTGDEECN